jgi:hypothetical protein
MSGEIDPVSIVKLAFYTGFKAANQLNKLPLLSKAEEIPDLLMAITKGTLTLQQSATDLRQANPNYLDDIEAIVAENIKAERGVVNIISTKTR